MHHQREHKALKAYFAFLTGKGASAEVLQQREHILNQLDPYINPIELNGSAYRQAVDTFLSHTEKSSWPINLIVIREYFHFWQSDIKAIAALNQTHGFDIHLSQWQMFTGNLKQIWATLDQETLSTSEIWACKAYTAVLNQKGYDKETAETRVKLAKLLLIKLRSINEPSARDYRNATDAMLVAFEVPALRHLFLLVVREFYYFWAGDPEASQYVKEAV